MKKVTPTQTARIVSGAQKRAHRRWKGLFRKRPDSKRRRQIMNQPMNRFRNGRPVD